MSCSKNDMKKSLLFLFLSMAAFAQNSVTVFDKGLDSFANVRDFSISSSGDEAFFTIQSPVEGISQIVSIKKEKDKWSSPELLPFCDQFQYLEPFLTHDGKRLYFVSDRPIDAEGSKKDMDVWFVERASVNSKWSKPANPGAPLNSELNEFYPSVTTNGNVYITIDSPKGLGKDDIYFCKWNGTNFESPVLLNENVNSAGYEFNAFVSPSEDFLIFTKYNEKGGFGSGDLYVSKKGSDGTWQKAVNLGDIVNTKYMEYCPFYDLKTQTLYFTSRRNNLTPRKFKDLTDLKQYVSEGENGLSKIYKVVLPLR